MPVMGPERYAMFEITKGSDAEKSLSENYILPWANSLAGNRILDLATGQGFEARELARNNFWVAGVDLSREMLRKNFHSMNVVGLSGKLPFRGKIFNGALMKDAWIFFSPKAKGETLGEIKRVLKPGGSLLLITEIGDKERIFFGRKDGGDGAPFYDSYPNDYNWQQRVDQTNKYSKVGHVEFICTVQSAQEVANENGFNCEILREYDHFDPLACESRWNRGETVYGAPIGKSGFIAKLTPR